MAVVAATFAATAVIVALPLALVATAIAVVVMMMTVMLLEATVMRVALGGALEGQARPRHARVIESRGELGQRGVCPLGPAGQRLLGRGRHEPAALLAATGVGRIQHRDRWA